LQFFSGKSGNPDIGEFEDIQMGVAGSRKAKTRRKSFGKVGGFVSSGKVCIFLSMINAIIFLTWVSSAVTSRIHIKNFICTA